jgi:hypothetical protein
MKEVETMHGLKVGRLSEEIEARLKGVVEPSVEKMRGAIRKEIRTIEEEFLVNILSPRGKKVPEEQAPFADEPSKKSTSGAPGQPEEGDARKPGSEEGPPIKTPPRQEGVYIPDNDPTLRIVKVPEMKEPRA